MVTKVLGNEIYDWFKNAIPKYKEYTFDRYKENYDNDSMMIVHTRTGMCYQFRGNDSSTAFFPYFDTFLKGAVERVKGSQYLNTDVLKNNIYQWTQIVRLYEDEQSAPELWKENDGSKIIDFNQDTNFTTDELQIVRKGIEEIKGLLKDKFALDEEKQKYLDARMDYLIENSEKNSKLNWKHLVYGELLGIGFELALDNSKRDFLWNLFKGVFDSILLIGPHPL